ncbi:MAG: AbrB/MazE/SpoVT family DNA-binding domain-containing protein [Candidatus Dependentiae bacterium]
MNKKLTKLGNSFALIIDKPILKLLNITAGTTLKIGTDGKKIIIEPVIESKKISKDKKLQKLYEELVQEYGPALEKLAK